jgi:hypothetical protein
MGAERNAVRVFFLLFLSLDEVILKICLGEIGWGGMVWIDLAQDKDQWGLL